MSQFRSRLPPAGTLIVFEAVARRLGFTAAARELGVSQAATSRQVRILEDYLGVKVTRHEDRTIELTTPQIIDSVLQDLGLLNEDGSVKPNATTRETPALSSRVIGPDPQGKPFDYGWNY